LSPQDVFMELVSRCIDTTASQYLQEGRAPREEVLLAKQTLQNDPSTILERFEAGLREAVATTLWLRRVTCNDLVH
jgi:hypothetical protein